MKRIMLLTISILCLFLCGCEVVLMEFKHEPFTTDMIFNALKENNVATVQIDNDVTAISDITGDFTAIYKCAMSDDVIFYYLEAVDTDTALYNFKKWKDKVITLDEQASCTEYDDFSYVEGTSSNMYYFFLYSDIYCFCIKTDKYNKDIAKSVVDLIKHDTAPVIETTKIYIESKDDDNV